MPLLPSFHPQIRHRKWVAYWNVGKTQSECRRNVETWFCFVRLVLGITRRSFRLTEKYTKRKHVCRTSKTNLRHKSVRYRTVRLYVTNGGNLFSKSITRQKKYQCEMISVFSWGNFVSRTNLPPVLDETTSIQLNGNQLLINKIIRYRSTYCAYNNA